MTDNETMAPEDDLQQAPVQTTEDAAREALAEISKQDPEAAKNTEKLTKADKPAKAEKADKAEKPGKLPTVDPNAPRPFELPAYTARWNQAARDALKAIHEAQHNRAHLDPILAQLDETNKYVTTKEQEYEQFRKQAGPIWDIVGPLEQQYRMQGMTLQQGIGQLVEAAKFVASDPDQAFPWFSGMYTPRDPAKAVQAMAQQWGVNLNQLVEEAPYVDPTIHSLVSPLEQRLRQFEARQSEQEEAARRAEQQQIMQAVAELEQMKDEAGNLRYPHFKDVAEDLILIAQRGRAKDFDTAYAMAVRMNPELSAQADAERAKAAEDKAIQEAKEKSEAAQKQAAANRNVAGKGRGGVSERYQTTEDATRAAYAQLQSE